MNNVIIVGPSGRLKEQKIGHKIDKFNIVCRINWGGRPESMVDEYKEIIGTKKDIWFCGHTGLINMFPCYPGNFERSFYRGYSEVVIHNSEMYEMHKSRISNLKLCKQEIIDNCSKEMFNFNGFKKVPTTGMLTIFYMLSKREDITVCGFDGHHGGHWYGNKYLETQEKSNAMALTGYGRHDVIKEHEYFNHLVEINRIKNYE